MNFIGSITPSVVAFMALSSMAHAAPITLDFEFFDERQRITVLNEALELGVRIYDGNWGSYGALPDRLTTGNDGFHPKASITAQPGKLFSALTVDIKGVMSEIRSVSCDGVDTVSAPWWSSTVDDVACDDRLASDSVQDELDSTLVADFLEITAYRDGIEQVSLRMEPTANSLLEFEDLGDFTNLTRLDIGVILVGFEPRFRPERNTWEYCEGGRRCGFVEFDNLALDIFDAPTASPTPVPLPAGAVLLSAALGLLARATRRK